MLTSSEFDWLADVFEDNGWTWAVPTIHVPTQEEISAKCRELMDRAKELPVGHSIGTGRLEATHGSEGVTLHLWVTDEWNDD